MSYQTQLKKGRLVEREHYDTYKKIERKKMSARQFETSIAKDHLKEDPNYYTKLKKAKL